MKSRTYYGADAYGDTGATIVRPDAPPRSIAAEMHMVTAMVIVMATRMPTIMKLATATALLLINKMNDDDSADNNHDGEIHQMLTMGSGGLQWAPN